MPTKKTDRRTAYTRMAIKDALLHLMQSHSYQQLTVTSVCREAEVTRATFYLHYNSLDEVMSEALSDALNIAEKAGDATSGPENSLNMPLCQRTATNPKYHSLFCDHTLAAYIAQKLYSHARKKEEQALQKQYGLTAEEASNLFIFLFYGSYALNQSLDWQGGEKWQQTQAFITKFIEQGIGRPHNLTE